MKINAVILPNKKSSRDGIFELKEKNLPLSFLTVMCGVICGVIIYIIAFDKLNGEIWNLFTTFFTDFSRKSSPEIISGLMLSELPYYIIMIFSGCCLLGSPLILISTLIKSMAPSLLFAYLYSTYSLNGIEYVFLVLAPGKIVALFAIILLTESCLKMNNKLKQGFYGEAGEGECKAEFRKYAIRSLIIYLVFVLSDLLTFLTVKSFSSLFSF